MERVDRECGMRIAISLPLTLFLVALASFGGSPARAQLDVYVSPDITIDLDGTIVDDEAVGHDPNPGITSLVSLGPLPQGTDVVAYHRQSPGEALLALGTTVALGGSVYAPGDVISWNGSTYALAFDAVAAGLPAGVSADAVGRDPLGNILLSFDQTVDLGSGVIAADEDVVRYVGTVPSIAFDGSAAGLPDALDVDGVHGLDSGRFVLSFDTGGTIGGAVFADEDLVYVDPSLPTWQLLVDGSSLDADLSAADVDAIALPEPHLVGSLVAGICLLGWLKAKGATG
jgi:hypothetical protein